MSPFKLTLLRWGFSLPFAAMGVYMSLAARRVLLKKLEWRRRGILAEGEIVDFKAETPTNEPAGHPLFAPVVAFTAQDGETIRFTSARSLRPNPYVVGQRVRVRYLSGDPDGADLEAVTGAWWPLAALVVMIAVAFTVAALPFILPPPDPSP